MAHSVLGATLVVEATFRLITIVVAAIFGGEVRIVRPNWRRYPHVLNKTEVFCIGLVRVGSFVLQVGSLQFKLTLIRSTLKDCLFLVHFSAFAGLPTLIEI